MSIQSEITRISGNVADSLAAVEAQGVAVPADGTSDDLPYLITKIRVTPQQYGAAGNGTTDDTEAFRTALSNSREVHVPGGTYKLSGTITIGENCRLVLSQDTVLNFTQTNTNGISMTRLANLEGNHATINVPYTFNAHVIHISTDVDDASSNDVVPPFTRWDPQWKTARYITDINICKPDSRGFHYSLDGDCYGTGIFINCDNTDPTTFMWGVSMTGIRIAGGFTYGIRAYNEGTGWNHDMRVEAVIDACETGVSCENCNNAHFAVTIQPRRAYSLSEVYKPYAKWGIRLVDSTCADLSQSAVWDWNAENTLIGSNNQYQHIAMFGNCSGANIFDYSAISSNYFWQRIYYDNIASVLNATVHGAKGKIPPDPKYAFYKNVRNGSYDHNIDNLSWRDYHNMVRYDVPVAPLNAYSNPNHLYRIGSFTIGGEAENPISGFSDALDIETVTIEENNYYGLIGWSNLFCNGSSVSHYWSPLPSVYESRVPIYFYSVSGKTFTIYRLIRDAYDMQHLYNCRVSITNTRRFVFDFADMGAISNLSTSTYIRLTPQIQTGSPKIAGQYGYSGGKPVVCTKSATFGADGSETTAATVTELATAASMQSFLDNLKVTPEQTTFIKPSEGEYVTEPKFEDVKAPYQDGYWYNSNGVLATIDNSILINARSFTVGDVIRIRGVDFSSNYPGKARVYVLSSSGAYVREVNIGSLITSAASGTISYAGASYSWDAGTQTLTYTITDSSYAGSYQFAFGGGYSSGYNAEKVIMTVNEEIEYETKWVGEPKRLDDSLYAQKVMLTSPSGNVFELSVSDTGVISATQIK